MIALPAGVPPRALVLAVIALGAILSSCTGTPGNRMASASTVTVDTAVSRPSPVVVALATAPPLPGMPPVTDPRDIYAADRAGELSPVVQGFRSLIYVPNTVSSSIDVIDPKTDKIVGHFRVGRQPQHVVPSYDLKTLWVLNDLGDSLTAIDPATGRKGRTIRVEDPYNMYYTPDGKHAIVVAERLHRLDFRDPQTMKLEQSVAVPCKGVDHIDFSANGRYLVASCEFSAELIAVDVAGRRVVAELPLRPGGMPQDVKLSPDGKIFYVADMQADGIYEIDAVNFTIAGFLPSGKGTHGLYVSRDSRVMYASNREEGSISVIDLENRRIFQKWRIPRGGSPDMGGVSADGKVLWLSGRYSREVYAIDTGDGHLLARIHVARGPHGLCVYPQPGRYSLGHTGIFR